jgi:putative salt-induced outer membrane protein YdiY
MRKPAAAWIVLPAVLALLPRFASADEVIFKDGSRLVGEVLELSGGKLKVRTLFNKEVEADWAEVASLTTEKKVPFLLKDGTILNGKGVKPDAGGFAVQTDVLTNAVPLDHDSIVGINEPIKPKVTFKGFFAAGATVNDGNTQNRSATVNGEFVARSERHRYTLRGIYNYADDNHHEITAQNGRLTNNYNFFITSRFYAFLATLNEHDKFQDLNLRSAVGAGPGWQIFDKGDFKENWLKELMLSAEVGISYFDEDYKTAPDRQYVAARWAVNLNWEIVPKKVTLFHNDEGYPSLEKASDLYVITETGVRLAVLKNLFAALQINYRWQNRPVDDKERNDTTYIISIGYNFDFNE